MKKIKSVLPTQSLIYFLICGVGIIIFVLLIIIPAQKTSAQLDKDIEKLAARLDEQRILKPVFDNLLNQVKKKDATELPAPKKVKLARGDIHNISEHLLETARSCDLILRDIQTDVKTLENNAEFLEDLLSRADTALYEVKKNGGNQSRFYDRESLLKGNQESNCTPP